MNVERTEQLSIHLVSTDRRLTVWAALGGCVEVHTFSNRSTAGDVRQDSDVNLVHVCDFDAFLEELQDAKRRIDAWTKAVQ